jgi:hypothetical protein
MDIKFNQLGQGFFDLETKGDKEPVTTPDRVKERLNRSALIKTKLDMSDETEPKQATTPSPEISTAKASAMAPNPAALATEVSVAMPNPEISTAEVKNPAKVYTQQEKDILRILGNANLCDAVSHALNAYNNGDDAPLAKIFEPNIRLSPSSMAKIKIRDLNANIKAALKSGLWEYRKNQEWLVSLTAEDRRTDTKDNLNFDLFKTIRYDESFRTAIKQQLQSQAEEFTFAQLLNRYNDFMFQKYRGNRRKDDD